MANITELIRDIEHALHYSNSSSVTLSEKEVKEIISLLEEQEDIIDQLEEEKAKLLAKLEEP